MNRIDVRLNQVRQEGKKAFIPFITAGDPDLAATKKLVLAMAELGADVIELGIPFSDPMAEGPIIQAANERALRSDIDTDAIMDMVAELRRETQVPLVYLLYYNSILSYGREAFFRRCAECSADGVIIPDLPYEERDEVEEYADRHGIYRISLVAPTSRERLEKIASSAKGFLYCVSSLGVTGVRDHFETNFQEFFGEIRRYCRVPMCVGFGISTPEQAAEVKAYCDGVIVGSAIVERVGACTAEDERLREVRRFLKALRDAV